MSAKKDLDAINELLADRTDEQLKDLAELAFHLWRKERISKNESSGSSDIFQDLVK